MDAELIYFSHNGHYANLADLGPGGANLISKPVSTGMSDGYRFELKNFGIKFELQAWPLRYKDTGFACYYSDETGVIRRTWAPEHANASSPRAD